MPLSSSKVVPSDTKAPIQKPRVVKNLLSWVLYFLFGILLPDGTFRALWDIVITALLGFISIALPITLAFNDDVQWSPECPERWPGVASTATESVRLRLSPIQAVMYAIDGIFAVDILINFRTAYVDEESHLIASHASIAAHYLRTWFVFDFVSIFPFDVVLASPGFGVLNLFKSTRLIKLAKVLRFLRIMKMLKLLRLPRIFSTLRAVVGKAFISMIMLLFGILMVCTGLLWIPVWRFNSASVNRCSSVICTWARAHLQVTHLAATLFYYIANHYQTYVTALYWALSTVTTVGYGDVVPGNAMEQIASMIGMGIGVSIFSYLIGSLVSMLAALQKESSFVAEHKEKLEHFIRCECVLHIFRDILPCVPIFCGRPHAFAIQLVSIMVLEFFAPEDVIIKQGSFSDTLYILVEGPPVSAECRRYNQAADVQLTMPQLSRSQARRVLDGFHSSIIEASGDQEISDSDEEVKKPVEQHPEYVLVTEIGPGQAFGEHAFFTGKLSWATVVACSCCQAQTVQVGPFCRVLHEWPDIRHDVMVHATRLSRVAEDNLEQQEKEKQQDLLQNSDTWPQGTYGDEFDPRDQEFRIG